MRFVFIGGDLRRHASVQTLQTFGHQAVVFDPQHPDGTTLLRNAQCAVLPYPALTSGYIADRETGVSLMPTAVLDQLQPGTVVAGGNMDALTEQVKSRDLIPLDYGKYPPLLQENAELTAEAALSLAVTNSPGALYGSSCLVIGFGRIGQALARRLDAAGARLCIAARKQKVQDQIQSAGWESVSTDDLLSALSRVDYVFNTVPATLFSAEATDTFPKGLCLIELASAPGCLDPALAAGRPWQYVTGSGLPGRFSPRAAGRLVAEHLWNMIKEHGYAD